MTIPRSEVMMRDQANVLAALHHHIPGVCVSAPGLEGSSLRSTKYCCSRVKVSDRQPKGVRITHVRLVRPQSGDPNIGARVK